MHPRQLHLAFLTKLAFGQDDISRLIPDEHNRASDFFLMPGAQRRAGRARGLAEAFGNEVPMSVDTPWTSRMINVLPGMLAGGAIGGAAGYLGRPSYSGNSLADHAGTVRSTTTGTVIGSAAGAMLGMLFDTIKRRRQIREVTGQARGDLAAGENPSPAIGKGSPFAALASGVHQQGRADTAEAIAHGRRSFDSNPAMTGLHAFSMLPYVGALSALPHAVGSAVNYGESRGRIDAARPVPTRNIA